MNEKLDNRLMQSLLRHDCQNRRLIHRHWYKSDLMLVTLMAMMMMTMMEVSVLNGNICIAHLDRF